MSHLPLVAKKIIVASLIQYIEILNKMRMFIMFLIFIIIIMRRFRKNKQLSENSFRRHQIRELNYHQMIHESDLACIENTRMDRKTFFQFMPIL